MTAVREPLRRLDELFYIIASRDQQRVTHQLRLDDEVRSAGGTFAQALRERLRWLSSHAGSESPLLNIKGFPVIPRGKSQTRLNIKPIMFKLFEHVCKLGSRLV